jgi:hypothetical protein
MGNLNAGGAANGASDAILAEMGIAPEFDDTQCKKNIQKTLAGFESQMGELQKINQALEQIKPLMSQFPIGDQSKLNSIMDSLNSLTSEYQKLKSRLLDCEKKSQRNYPLDNFKALYSQKTFNDILSNPQSAVSVFQFDQKQMTNMVDMRKMCREHMGVERKKCKEMKKKLCQVLDMMSGQLDPNKMMDMQNLMKEMNALKAPQKMDDNCENLGKLMKGEGDPKSIFEKALQDGMTSGATGGVMGGLPSFGR